METITRVGLAVAEAVANAIEHGNQGIETQTVRVQISPEAGSLYVLVADEGRGVSAERLLAASLPDDPLQPDGRGLYLIRELADRSEVKEGSLYLWFRDRP